MGGAWETKQKAVPKRAEERQTKKTPGDFFSLCSYPAIKGRGGACRQRPLSIPSRGSNPTRRERQHAAASANLSQNPIRHSLPSSSSFPWQLLFWNIFRLCINLFVFIVSSSWTYIIPHLTSTFAFRSPPYSVSIYILGYRSIAYISELNHRPARLTKFRRN